MRTLLPFLLLFFSTAASSQQVARDNYLHLLPAMPMLVTQTEANVRFALYGDSGAASYLDRDENGVDDARQRTLHAIADRFSPVLRRNNFSIPVNFRRVLADDPVITVDTWHAGRLVRTQHVPLSGSLKSSADDGSGALLGTLIETHMPERAAPAYITPEDYSETVMFLDFPGHDPTTWRAAYRDLRAQDATTYVHFFVHADTTAGGGYFLVAQYWFFYPFNDAANNHEGDWEHINVLITTEEALRRRTNHALTPDELSRVLDGSAGLDVLRIAFVDYYFHENVITLDYAAAQLGRASERRQSWYEKISVWRDTSFATRVLARRLASGNGRFLTHPIGYIGGNNKGPDELLSIWPRFRASFNRNSHGTYPFPGTWNSVGPLGSTERIPGREVPPADAAQLAEAMFVTFDASNIHLLPDWERIAPLLARSAAAQNEWSWLVLPLRWGFPVSVSPGAGALSHVDVGNVAPEGPPYQPTWNRVGTASGWRRYDADVLRVIMVPTAPWDEFNSGYGFLNLPVGALGFMPGWNVVTTQIMPWLSGALSLFGATTPRTFRPQNAIIRFSSMSAGPYRQLGGDAFAQLLPEPNSDLVRAQVGAGALHAPDSTLRRSPADGYRLGLTLHYGPRLTVENTFATAGSNISASLVQDNGQSGGNVSASIQTGDLTGGLRYTVWSGARNTLQSFVKTGYGWSWYRVHDATVNDRSIPYELKSGYLVSLLPSSRWWPNSWYAGAGVEYFSPRRGWVLQQFGYGVRADYTRIWHRLGADRPRADALGTVARSDFSVAAVVGW